MKVIKSDTLSKPYDFRFVIVDDNGNVIDDAQGYGYTSAQKAHAAWGYKHNKKAKIKRKRKERWWKKHPEFEAEVENIRFRVWKDEQHGVKHTKKELFEACSSIAKEMGIEDFREDLI